MSIGSGLAIYFVIWWTTLFAVLPFGVKSQREAGEVSPGSDPGAPAVTRISRIVFWNSLVAGAVFALFRLLVWPLI
jgi:predicted secreted protein